MSNVTHYCTLFDSRYAVVGVALWLSLRRQDPEAMLWVLGLDNDICQAIQQLDDPRLRVVPLKTLESEEPDLAAARTDRSWIEYVFTLSPCWPRYLLRRHSDIEFIVSVDADMAFFSSPAPFLNEVAGHDVLIVEHRFPAFLAHLVERGRFNVGIQCFRNSAAGRACLDDWMQKCLQWCGDRVEAGRFADQKYLDRWPDELEGVAVSRHPGVNLAPWNWMNYRYEFADDHVLVDGEALIAYHFARFKGSGRRYDSGQLEYGVMPFRLRREIYGRYLAWLAEASRRLADAGVASPGLPAVARGHRTAWRSRILEVVFGSVWWWCGGRFFSGGWGVGQYSGRLLRMVRRWRQQGGPA